MSVQIAIASGCPQEIFVARTARSKKPVEESFGECLARLRKERDDTQTELGEILGLSQRVMTYYEREDRRPPAHLLGRMAEALGVSVDELLGLKPVAEDPAPRDTRPWRKLREIEKLPAGDRQAVIKLVDGMLARHKLESQGTRR
jgi:transcriptional regulator with XRE-family HTH domain